MKIRKCFSFWNQNYYGLQATQTFKRNSFSTKNTYIFYFKNLKIVCIDFVLSKLLIQENCNKQQFTIIMDRAKVFQNDPSPQQMKTFNHLSHEPPSPITCKKGSRSCMPLGFFLQTTCSFTLTVLKTLWLFWGFLSKN